MDVNKSTKEWDSLGRDLLGDFQEKLYGEVLECGSLGNTGITSLRSVGLKLTREHG